MQALDVSVNRPFKDHVRHSCVSYVHSQVEEEKEDSEEAVCQKLKPPSKQQVLDGVVAVWEATRERQELIRKSFKVCGISNKLDGSEDHLLRKELTSHTLTQEEDDEHELNEDSFVEFELD